MILGPSATYGSSERRPKLDDGRTGLVLRREQNLTVVAGAQDSNPHESDETSEPPFKRRIVDQRVDFIFSPYNVRLTISYERYQYSVSRDGNLKHLPLCPNLEKILQGQSQNDSASESDFSLSSIDTNLKPPSYTKAVSKIHIGDQYMYKGESVMEVSSITRQETDVKFDCRCVGGVGFNRKSPKESLVIQRTDAEELLKDILSFA